MIHFTCDGCQREIDSEVESRYVVRLEVYPAVDATDGEQAEDLDHLQAIDEMLERLDEADLQGADLGEYEHVRYDLCEDCRARFMKNPLGRPAAAKLGFSDN